MRAVGSSADSLDPRASRRAAGLDTSGGARVCVAAPRAGWPSGGRGLLVPRASHSAPRSYASGRVKLQFIPDSWQGIGRTCYWRECSHEGALRNPPTAHGRTVVTNRERSHWRGLLGNLLLAGTSLMLALLAAEAAFEALDAYTQAKRARRARPFYTASVYTFAGDLIGSERGPLRLMLNPLVGTVNLPDQNTPFFRINHLGFRGRELGAKEADRHRVILVGGSAAFGTGLGSDEETLAAQLEHRLPDTEVVNAAIIGKRSGQELALLVSELVDLEPDQLVTLDGWNDFWAIQEEPTPWPDVNGTRQVQEALKRLYALSYAPLYVRLLHLPDVLFAYTLRRFDASPLEASGNLAAVEGTTHHSDLEGIAARYARNQVKMSRIAAAFGAGFLCVIQPNGDVMRGATSRYPRFREQIEAQLSLERVAWLDLNNRADVLQPDMFMDPIHLDARGNAAIADVLAPVLEAALRRSESRNMSAPEHGQ
jgi:lysophospholipase L1-like esterase